MPKVRVCDFCGKAFDAFIGNGTKRTGFFCGLECRFWGNVAYGADDECWPFIGHVQRYGSIRDGKLRIKAHRLAWTLTNGPVPEGMSVCHSCDNPPCCNPRHLWIGTLDDNMADKVAKSRQSRGPAHAATLAASRTRGVDHFRSKTNPDEVRAIRAAYAAGEQQKSIAARVGLGSSTVHQILRRKTWREVD